MDKQPEDEAHVATIESPNPRRGLPSEAAKRHARGTVRLFQNGSVILIPMPSPDPKDPLNLPTWHKYLIIFTVGAYCAVAVLGTSGLGAVFPSVESEYAPKEAVRATDLLTYPTLFMGIGNLLSMPLCVTLGRRPVFLFSLVVLILSGLWCAFSGSSLSSHIAGRNIFSLAAGQSEALAPYVVEEVHFLHERSAKLAWFIGVQTVGSAAGFVATAYLVPARGFKWWYIMMTLINVAILVLAYVFVVESKYDRPLDSGLPNLQSPKLDDENSTPRDEKVAINQRAVTREAHVLQPEVYGPRTWRHTLRIFHSKPEWKQTILFYRETAKGLCVPQIVWLLLFNGSCLGIYVYQSSTFATVLMAPPYAFRFDYLGIVQVVQILDTAIMVPILGYGGDVLARFMSKRRSGIFQPEYRLILLSMPIVSAILATVLYGQAAQNPQEWHWMTIVAPYHLGYFSFLGANLLAITYAIDSFPNQAGPLLLVICAGRGFISFGLSYSTVPLINKTGYDGAMNVFAIISGILGAITLPMYFFGRRIRAWATSTFWPETEE